MNIKMPVDGEMVYYTLGEDSNRSGEVRPALVVRVWSEQVVNLLVFLDGDNDKFLGAEGWYTFPTFVMWKTSVVYDDTGGTHGWHRADGV